MSQRGQTGRRHLLCAGLTLSLPLPGLGASRTVPFRRLAVMDPPFEESYEVLIAMAPPLARGLIGKALTRVASEADVALKTEQLTAALVEALDAPKENIRVWIHDMPKENWGIAGKSAKDLGR